MFGGNLNWRFKTLSPYRVDIFKVWVFRSVIFTFYIFFNTALNTSSEQYLKIIWRFLILRAHTTARARSVRLSYQVISLCKHINNVKYFDAGSCRSDPYLGSLFFNDIIFNQNCVVLTFFLLVSDLGTIKHEFILCFRCNRCTWIQSKLMLLWIKVLDRHRDRLEIILR